MSDGSRSPSQDSLEDAAAAPQAEVAYDVNVETAVPNTGGQLFKTVLVEGTGSRPPKGSKVSVHYVGTLASDGSKFDSSRDRGDLFEFTLGEGQVIKGWDQGVATMRKGEKAILKCGPEYAYGKRGSPPKIPADATLNFEVELFGWSKSEDVSEAKNRSLMKGLRTPGSGWEHPDYESVAKASLKVYVDVQEDQENEEGLTPVWSNAEFGFTVGESVLPPGLEEALKSWKQGETSALDVAASVLSAASAESLSAFNLSATSQGVRYVVELTSFTKVKTWEYKGAAKVAEGVARKDQGNAFFKAGNLDAAIKKYKRSLEFIEHDFGLEGEEQAEASKAAISCFSNLAQCYLSRKQYAECITWCDKCLAKDAHHAKSLFRRGKARGQLEDYEAGKKDLKALLELDPANGDAVNELAAIVARERAFIQSQKAKYSNMFEKMSRMAEKEHAADAAAPAAAPAPAPSSSDSA